MNKHEFQHLECDVETIGCARMCHNMFYPMAQDRYWQLQVFCVALPSIIFIAYKSKVDLHINKALEVKKQREKEHFEEIKAEAEAEGKLTVTVIQSSSFICTQTINPGTTVHEYCKEYGNINAFWIYVY